jgi:hypothetical protein
MMEPHWSQPKRQLEQETARTNPQSGNFQSHFEVSIASRRSFPPAAPPRSSRRASFSAGSNGANLSLQMIGIKRDGGIHEKDT